MLSTLSPDNDTQSDISLISSHMQSVRKKSTSRGRLSSKRNSKSTSRTKKLAVPTNSTINNIFKKRNIIETNQGNKTPNQAENNVPAKVETNNLVHDLVQKKNQTEPEQRRLFTISPASTTSSTTRKNIPESHRKLVNSVFSSITKRKSTSSNENLDKEQAAEPIDFDDNVPHSPPRQPIVKRAKLVFKKCFQNTFDPRMLPGHDIILVEDSDENNSD